MLKGLKAMLGLGPRRERPAPDQITASVVIARQRNEMASENVRQLLIETLDRTDGLRGTGK